MTLIGANMATERHVRLQGYPAHKKLPPTPPKYHHRGPEIKIRPPLIETSMANLLCEHRVYRGPSLIRNSPTFGTTVGP